MPDSQGLTNFCTLRGAGESELVIQKSRFLGYCVPISSEQEAVSALNAIRKRHRDARHTCYAFRIVWNGGLSRSSDDGEPSGTAGVPILNVLTRRGVENALCAVVRYFGGVLLGTGGLCRAYGNAASEALAAAGVVEMRVCAVLAVDLSYAAYAALEPFFSACGYHVQASFSERVSLVCDVPREKAEAFTRLLTERTEGAARIKKTGERLYAFDEPCNLPNGGTLS